MENKTQLIEVLGGSKKGGYEFTVLKASTKQEFDFFELKKYTINNDVYWHGYITAKEIKTKKLPIDANPRKPSPTKVVKLMQSTIQKSPTMFHHLNNGITIICKIVDYNANSKKATITFGPMHGNHGDGICNGGHTYFAIEQFAAKISDDVLVRVELIQLDSSLSKDARAQQVKTIAEARNSHNELESITTAHYSGYYDKIIKYFGPNSIYFQWYEGDPNCIKNAEKVDTLIAKITSLSPHWYSHYLNFSGNQGNHMSAARNQGSIHRQWLEEATNEFSEKGLYYMIPLINDILKLKDEISYSLVHDSFTRVKKVWRLTRIWQYLSLKPEIELNFKQVNGQPVNGYNLSHTFATMLLGAFRENVWFSIGDNGINYVGWLKDPIKLWHAHKEVFMRNLDQIAGQISAPSFGNAFLQNAAIYNQQLTTLEFGAKLEANAKRPEIVYDTQSNQKYEITNSASEATHNLECNFIETGIAPFANMKPLTSGANSPFYKKENA